MRNGAAQGRVLSAVAKTWPGFITGAIEGRAREHIDAGRYEEAADVLLAGAERYGPDSVSQMLLAWCLHMAGRYEGALEWALRAVEEEPENPDAHWLQANSLFELERPEEATEALWRAVELTPDNGRYYMELAWFHYQDQEYVRTRELVEKALELAPEDAWVHYTAGRIFDHHLRHKLAQHHYERALELDPDDADPRYDLAEVLQARGRLSAGVRVVWETSPSEGDADQREVMYEATLRRWSWRWYEWALRAVLVLNVIDWIFPTPVWLGAGLAGILVVAYAGCYVRSLVQLPAACRRDLVARGRRGHFIGAVARSLVVLAGITLVLLGELSALQHLGVLALIIGGYAEWYWRAVKISGKN